jgi:hypothetical protein
VHIDVPRVALGDVGVVVRRDPDEDRRVAAAEGNRRNPRVFERLPRRLEEPALLRWWWAWCGWWSPDADLPLRSELGGSAPGVVPDDDEEDEEAASAARAAKAARLVEEEDLYLKGGCTGPKGNYHTEGKGQGKRTGM